MRRIFLGIDVGGSSIKAAAVDITKGGVVVQEETIATPQRALVTMTQNGAAGATTTMVDNIKTDYIKAVSPGVNGSGTVSPPIHGPIWSL